MKTNELTGSALDWAVAKCEKLYVSTDMLIGGWGAFVDYSDEYCNVHYQPSTHWGWAGAIIERERISLIGESGERWIAEWGWIKMVGDTPLIAAMRAYVASKFGNEIEIPEELIEEV